MKKTFLGCMLILIVGATQVNAQSISGGIKADANISNFILTDMDHAESNMGFGATLGGFAKFDIVKNFAIQPELLFHFQTSTWEQFGQELDYQYWGMEIPVYAMGQWYTKSNDRFYAAVGPYVGVGFDAKWKMDGIDDIDLYEKDDISDEALLQRWDFGFGAMLGYEFNFGLQINAGYKIGVINSLDAGKDDATMLPQKVSLGLAYRF